MTQTPPQSAERVTSRQRRIEEQRRKINAAQSAQRRKVAVWIAAIVVIIAIAGVGLYVVIPKPVAAQMHQVVLEPADHLAEGAPLTFRNRPPSSGVHFGTVPQAFEYRIYDQPLSPGRWVHMLEHGAVAVLYRSDLCDQTCVQQLGEFYDSAPRSTLVPLRHLVITPYRDMDHAIAVVAWGYLDEMDQMDKDRVMADFKSKVDSPTAPERGAM